MAESARERNIRGMLLEEVILFLLTRSGYRTIGEPGTDPTLGQSGAGLIVYGRGSKHQIDAIADYRVQQPFANPQRLLVEAKCLATDKKVGLPVIRNALGTYRDVSEFWIRDHRRGTPDTPPRPRYHYQYAVFSATGYTADAQDFAYAQDIHLFTVAQSAAFQPVINQIRAAASVLAATEEKVGELRIRIRDLLEARDEIDTPVGVPDAEPDPLIELQATARHLGESFIVMLGNRFPVFMTPMIENVFATLQSPVDVRVYWQEDNWIITDRDSRVLFSFDMPSELFDKFDASASLEQQTRYRQDALDVKQRWMSEFQTVRLVGEDIQIVRFVLDQSWLDQVRNRRGLEESR